MKYYSDITKALYDTAKACEEAEAAHLKAEEERKNGYKTALARGGVNQTDLLQSGCCKQCNTAGDARFPQPGISQYVYKILSVSQEQNKKKHCNCQETAQ